MNRFERQMQKDLYMTMHPDEHRKKRRWQFAGLGVGAGALFDTVAFWGRPIMPTWQTGIELAFPVVMFVGAFMITSRDVAKHEIRNATDRINRRF